MNKVILFGRLGEKPELKTLDNGNTVTSFSFATSEKYTDKQGNKVDQTEWHNIQFWDKQAEVLCQYVDKGDQLLIEGSIRYRHYLNKEGVKIYATDIRGDRFDFVSKPKQEEKSI